MIGNQEPEQLPVYPLTLDEIKAWLSGLPEDMFIALRKDPYACLVSRYCQQVKGIYSPSVVPYPTPDGDTMIEGTIRYRKKPLGGYTLEALPVEIVQLARRFDETKTGRRFEVSVKQALTLFDSESKEDAS